MRSAIAGRLLGSVGRSCESAAPLHPRTPRSRTRSFSCAQLTAAQLVANALVLQAPVELRNQSSGPSMSAPAEADPTMFASNARHAPVGILRRVRKLREKGMLVTLDATAEICLGGSAILFSSGRSYHEAARRPRRTTMRWLIRSNDGAGACKPEATESLSGCPLAPQPFSGAECRGCWRAGRLGSGAAGAASAAEVGRVAA